MEIQVFKPITVVGLNSKTEIEFDINLVMKMFHAYIAYLPIEQRLPVEQLDIADQMLKIQDLYNAEQKSALEYIHKKAAEEEVKDAGIDLHYKEIGPEEQIIDDLMESIRKSPVEDDKVESGRQFLENQKRVGDINYNKPVIKICKGCKHANEPNVGYTEVNGKLVAPCPVEDCRL